MRDEDNREIDRLRERYERENRGECEHGYLNRQCNTCELESALIEARAEIFRLSGSLDVGDRVIASSEHKLAAARAEIEEVKGWMMKRLLDYRAGEKFRVDEMIDFLGGEEAVEIAERNRWREDEA